MAAYRGQRGAAARRSSVLGFAANQIPPRLHLLCRRALVVDEAIERQALMHDLAGASSSDTTAHALAF
jgi:hypothetical protein